MSRGEGKMEFDGNRGARGRRKNLMSGQGKCEWAEMGYSTVYFIFSRGNVSGLPRSLIYLVIHIER